MNLPKKIKTFKGLLTLITALTVISLTLSSCLKNDDDYVATPNAGLLVINSSTIANNSFVYLGQQLLNSQPFPYSYRLGILEVTPGLYTTTIVDNTNTAIASKNVNFAPGKYHTIFMIDSNATKAGLLFTTDSISNPASGKAKIRFANLTYDAPSVDAGFQGEASAFSNQNFKSVSNFIEVDAGTRTFEVKQSGSSAAKISKSIDLEANTIYTIWTKGTWADTEDNEFDIQASKY